VPVVDEHGPELTIGDAEEDGLTTVGVLGADIKEPSQAEGLPVGNASKVASRKYFPNPVLVAEILRTEAQAGRRANRFTIQTEPTVRVSIEKCVGDKQRPPFRDGKAEGPIQLGTHDLVEKQIRPLKVLSEFQYIEMVIVRSYHDGFRPTTQFSQELLYNQDRHFLTREQLSKAVKPFREFWEYAQQTIE
jgi:hypothetical protein